ncbi:MAG: carboxypeptidase-like regulatory domain-containing protein [Bacteroidales bacterium]
MKNTPIITLLLLLSTTVLWAQPIQIRGKITDATTGKGVPSAHIFPKNNQQNGTISNEDGLFILNLQNATDTLIVSHVSYVLRHIAFQPDKTIYKIEVQPLQHALSEIVIKPVTAEEIVKRAINRIKENYKVHPVYYQFYTRIIAYSHDSTLHFFEEHTGDILIRKGIFINYTKIRPQKSRFRYLTDVGKKKFENQYMISMTSMMWDDLYKNTNEYLHVYRNMHYTYSFKSSVTLLNRACYVVAFETDRKTYYKSGLLYIDKETYAIAREVVGSGDGSIRVVSFQPLNGKWYLKSTRDLVYGRNISEQRTTLYNLISEPENTDDFRKIQELLPIKVEQLADDFDDNYWENRNVVPLPAWIEKALQKKGK